MRVETISSDRLRSLDTLRGMSIVLMLIAHIQSHWLREEDLWLIGIIFLIMNVHGTPGFTFVSGLGFGFSWQKKLKKGMSLKTIFNMSFSRTFSLFCLSICFNFVSILVRGNYYIFELFWYWNILQCITIARFIGLLMQKFPRWFQIVGTIGIWVMGSWLGLQILPNPQQNYQSLKIIYFIFYNPMHADSILIYFPFFMVGKWLGEDIFRTRDRLHQQDLKKNAQKRQFFINQKIVWIWTILAVSLLLLALFFGFQRSTLDYGWNLLSWINLHPNIELSGIRLFLIPNSYIWVLYCLSIGICLTLLIAFFLDFGGLNSNYQFFGLYGKFSLTVYIGHYTILLLPWLAHRFTASTIWIPMIGYILAIWLMLVLLMRYNKSNYSIEALLRIFSAFIYQKTNSLKKEHIKTKRS